MSATLENQQKILRNQQALLENQKQILARLAVIPGEKHLAQDDYNICLNLAQTLMVATAMSDKDRLARYGTEGPRLMASRIVEILNQYR